MPEEVNLVGNKFMKQRKIVQYDSNTWVPINAIISNATARYFIVNVDATTIFRLKNNVSSFPLFNNGHKLLTKIEFARWEPTSISKKSGERSRVML